MMIFPNKMVIFLYIFNFMDEISVHEVAIMLFMPILHYLDNLDMFRMTWIS